MGTSVKFTVNLLLSEPLFLLLLKVVLQDEPQRKLLPRRIPRGLGLGGKPPPISSEVSSLKYFVVVQSLSHVWLMDCSMPGFCVLHHLPDLAQTHVHWVGDAIQLSLPLSSPYPSAFSLSQHQGLFQWVSSSHQVAKTIGVSASALPMNIQDCFPLGLTG